MKKTTRIAIIGDFDRNRPSHSATNNALHHAATALFTDVDTHWLSTQPLESTANLHYLTNFDGIWGAPGDPASSLGVVNAIQVARENNIPYLGT